MKLLSRLQARVIVAAGCFLTASANADTTYAEAYTAVSGIPTVLNTDVGGASGANAYAIIPLQDVAVSSTAKSSVGSLHVLTLALASAPTAANGSARADWSSSFPILAPGYGTSDTGIYSGSISVAGGLVAMCGSDGSNGLDCIASASVIANASVSGHTGFNGGGVNLQGGGRRIAGNDIEGLEGFTLYYTVPFTFGEPIDVYLRLEVTSLANPLRPGTVASGKAEYWNSMTWQGISEVRDASGKLLTNFTAINPTTNFDFAKPAPVPEPSTVTLMLFGTSLVWGFLRRRTRAQR